MKAFRANLGLVSLLAVLAVLVAGPVRGVEAWMHLAGHAAAGGHGEAGGHVHADGAIPEHGAHDEDGEGDHAPGHPLDCSTCRELMMLAPAAVCQIERAELIAISSWCVDAATPVVVTLASGFFPGAPPTGPPRA